MDTKGKGGRKPTTDKADNCVMVRFTDEENARFLPMFEQSGVYAKAVFIKARVFNEEYRVVKIDSGALEYTAKLSALHSQIRAVGVNYNQVVKELRNHFSEGKAMRMLYNLEKQTAELVELSRRVVVLTEEFKDVWLQK